MDFAPTYLLYRLFYRVGDFFHHWYIDGSRAIAHKFISTLAGTDQSLALAITIRYFFQPLYKDYSVVGRILGIIFRTGRILIGLVVYLLIILVFLIFYLAWVATPALILAHAVQLL